MKKNKGRHIVLTAVLMLLMSSCGQSSGNSEDSLSSTTENTSLITEDSSLPESSADTGTTESSGLSESSDPSVPLVETLVRTIDFEELEAGNMSPTHHNVYYDGLIEADGRVTTTQSAKIDEKTLGMRMPANSSTDPRYCTIQVEGYTKVVLDLKLQSTRLFLKTNLDDIYQGAKAGDILRDVEIATAGLTELVFTFYTENPLASNMDCGFDNIRFYAMVEEGATSSEPPSSETPTSEEGSLVSSEVSSEQGVYDYITIRDIADYLEDKETHYPISDAYVKVYQQKSGGYIDYAKQLGKTVDKSICEPDQKFHFFDSWLNRSIEQGTLSWTESAKNRVYTKLLSPELLLWIYEACGAPTEKITNAYQAAVAGKDAGTHSATIAKNMRDCVPWEDLEVNIQSFLDHR
ncbi:MAG: hypothetical protein ACOX3K_03820 [Bacilli bacterium]